MEPVHADVAEQRLSGIGENLSLVEGEHIAATRCEKNPLITFASSATLEDNINGPSVIRAPAWVEKPLGTYYMYFAHHGGKHIRLAYTDSLSGPWKVYEPGVLQLDAVPPAVGHIASPDVHVEKEKKRVILYFHGPVRNAKGQKTFVATSGDGLDFEAGDEILGASYFRVFRWGGRYYAIDGGGYLNRSRRFDAGWERRDGKLIEPVTVDDQYGRRTNVRIRHSAVLLRGDTLYLFYTRKADAPERILVATVALTDDWREWRASDPVELLRPKEPYEGIEYPIRPSKKGRGTKEHALRDPCVFEEDGKVYLFYSVAGEMGIAMAELTMHNAEDGRVKIKAKRKPDQAWKEYPTRTVALLAGYVPSTIPCNEYGSRTDRHETATGFFHAKKLDGRWWLIDPEGRPHFNLAVVSVRPGRGPAQQETHERIFRNNAAWADATTRLLREHGFNGTGAWSDDDLLRGARHRLTYCVNWKFMTTFGRGRTQQASGHRAFPGDCIFVFDPDWPAFCESHAARHLAPLKDDPYLLGHFFDNELPLKPGMLRRFLNLPKDTHGFKAARAYIDARLDAETSAEDVVRDDWRAFDDLVMERYLGTIARAIRKADPNHMLLGPRLYSRNASFSVIGKYVDAFAYNLYNVWSPAEKATELAAVVGKPLIVTEYYVKGMDAEGLTNESGAGWCVPTQHDRGLFYQNFGLDLLESGVCIGWQWFKYQDNDPTDLKTDPSNRNSNKGILNSDYEPYTPLLETMRELNARVYTIIDHLDARQP